MKKFEVRNSRIHGRGLVATQDIAKGEFIGFIKGPVRYEVNQTLRETFSNPDWVGFKRNHWVDPEPPFKYLNHACSASCGVKGVRTLHAVRNIKKGEELTIDYSTTELDENWFLDCQCKLPECRKRVASIQSLPKRVFNRYDPYIPTYNRHFYLMHCL